MTVAMPRLDPVPQPLRAAARAALESGDAVGFLVKASNEYGLILVWKNSELLRTRGMYETALLPAFTATRLNNHTFPADELTRMFQVADRGRLRAAGDPLPGDGPFTVYRGVAGVGRRRRVRGLSWSADSERAAFFARRFALADPAVFRVAIGAEDVLAYSDGRKEQEFLVLLPATARPVRVCFLTASEESN